MAQYITKPLEDIRNDVQLIAKNLAPLVGCRVDDSRWSPYVAAEVCNQFDVSRTQVTNIGFQSIINGSLGSWSFWPNITEGASEVYSKVKEYSPDVLNPYYVLLVGDQIPVSAKLPDKLRMASTQSYFTDSTIFDAIYRNPAMAHSKVYSNTCLLLLTAFTVRYYLLQFSDELNLSEINEELCNQAVQNIDFIKAQVATMDTSLVEFTTSYNYLSHQLSYLRKNFNMIKSQILKYVRG